MSATRKSPLRDRFLSNSPYPIKSSIMRESGMGWISPTPNSENQGSGSSGSITSPLRIAKRDSPRSLPELPVARRSSSSYRHVRENNLVSKSPFKSQIPTHSSPARPVSFPSPRRVSGEKRPRPSSMYYQAEDENERPFALKRERRQSKTFQGLIQREPVTKSPFRKPAVSTERQSLSPPPPLFHLLPTEISSRPSTELSSFSLSISSVPPVNLSPGRSSLVSRRMHGPRLSSGSQSRRRRRKTVTWDENCDVVEISADENESDSDEKEEQGIRGDHEEECENDSFFHGDRFQNEERVTDEPSYENDDFPDASSDDDPSLRLDPDASISGLVEEMFASSSGKTINASPQNTVDIPSSDGTISTPPQAIGSHFPLDLNTEDRIPPGWSHRATQSLRHRGECSLSPKQSLPHFSLQQVGDDQVSSIPAQASHGPPVTPPRQCSLVLSPGAQTPHPFDAAGEVAANSSSSSAGSPAASENVYSSHVVTPTLSRSTHAERHQLAHEEDCKDIYMLPEFEVDIGSSGPSSILSKDPLSLTTLILPIDRTGPATTSTDHHNVSAKLAYTSSVLEDAQLREDQPVLAFEGCSHFESLPDVSQHCLKSLDGPSFDDPSEGHHQQQRSRLSDANNSRSHTPDTTSFKADDEDILAEDDMSAGTNTSTETAIIEHAERRIMAGTPVMEGETVGPVEAAQKLEFDVGSNIEHELDLEDIGSDSITASIDTHGVIRPANEGDMPSIQTGGKMRMGDVNLAMDMRSALDRLMDDVAGTHADDSVMTEDKDLLDIYQPVRPSALNSRIMERAATESALLHNNSFVSRNFSASSNLSIAPPPPPKNNIRSREQMILEKRREARRVEYEEFTPHKAGRDEQRLLGMGRPSRRRSMSMGDADTLGVDAEKRADTLLDVIGVGDMDDRDGELGDSIEKELKKMVADPTRKKTRYHIREREGTIYASSSDSDIISHMVGPGDVNVGRAWRPVRRPSDMNEYSKQIKEYRAQEKSGKAYGKVFVKVLGVKNIDIPLPRQPTFLTCTLNNGIHFVSTPECQLGRDFRIEQEFELIEHNKLEFTLTLKVRRDSHVIAQFHELTPSPPPVVAPPVVQNSSKGGMRSFFSSSPKKSAKEKLPVQNLPPPPQLAHRLPENLARYLKPDGTMARAFISFKDIASRCDTRLFETSYPLIGQRAEVGGKFSTLQAGEIILQIFRLPALPGIAPEQLPQSLEECHRGLRHINWHKVTYFEGILTQSGGDCSTWRRRQLRVIGANLVAFNDVTKKATAAIDLKKAIAVEDNQESRKNALSPGGASHYDEDDGLYGVERSFRLVFSQGEEILFFADTDDEKARWLDVLRALVGHIPPHPFWAELLWQRQEELTRASQPSLQFPPHSSPSWLISRGSQQ